MYQGIWIHLSAMRAGKLLAEAELLKPGSITRESGHACLPERIPTAHAARPSSREFMDTTSQSSGREAADPTRIASTISGARKAQRKTLPT